MRFFTIDLMTLNLKKLSVLQSDWDNTRVTMFFPPQVATIASDGISENLQPNCPRLRSRIVEVTDTALWADVLLNHIEIISLSGGQSSTKAN